jgi:hypothetical protein
VSHADANPLVSMKLKRDKAATPRTKRLRFYLICPDAAAPGINTMPASGVFKNCDLEISFMSNQAPCIIA